MRSTARSRTGLLLALGVDNLGSGFFLPLVLSYSTTVVGLSLATAGLVLAVGAGVGLVAPLLVGRVVDRIGPRRVVVTSRLVQAAGMASYVVAGFLSGTAALAATVLGAVLVAAGTQTFYSSLFTLIAAVAGEGPKDRAFAHVDMVRALAFGAGSLLAAGLFAALGDGLLRAAVAVDGASSLLGAVLLWRLVRVPVVDRRSPGPGGPAVGPWRNRPFLVLLLVIALTALASDVFLVGVVAWAALLDVPLWVPGTCVALLTVISGTCAALVVGWTVRWRRTRTVGVGTLLTVVWCSACAATPLVPASVRPVWLLGATVLLAGSGLLIGTRVLAIAEASAPVAGRGRYLATVQYSFNAAQLVAPLLVGLFTVAPWVPWAVIAGCCALALVLLPWLGRRLPAAAVGVQPAGGAP